MSTVSHGRRRLFLCSVWARITPSYVLQRAAEPSRSINRSCPATSSRPADSDAKAFSGHPILPSRISRRRESMQLRVSRTPCLSFLRWGGSLLRSPVSGRTTLPYWFGLYGPRSASAHPRSWSTPIAPPAARRALTHPPRPARHRPAGGRSCCSQGPTTVSFSALARVGG